MASHGEAPFPPQVDSSPETLECAGSTGGCPVCRIIALLFYGVSLVIEQLSTAQIQEPGAEICTRYSEVTKIKISRSDLKSLGGGGIMS